MWKDVSSADTMISERVWSQEHASSGSLYLLACKIDSRQSTTSRAVERARSLCSFCSRRGMTIWRASRAAGGMWSSSSVISLVNSCAMEGKCARCARRESTSGHALRYSKSVPNRLRTSTCMLLTIQLMQFSSSYPPCRYSITLFSHLYRQLYEREPSDHASSVSISSAISPSSLEADVGRRKSAKASWSEVSMSAAMKVRVCICGLALWCMGHLRPRVMSLSANDSLRAQCPRNSRNSCLILL